MKKIRLLPFLLLLSCYSFSQEDTGDIPGKLKGNWKANGTAFGMPATITMSWAPVLQEKFYRLKYSMVMTGKDGNQTVFEGTAYYKQVTANTFTATWFDSQGSMHPITASSDATMLTSRWGTPETQQGKTTYQLIRNNDVQVTDYILKKDGTWSLFNQNTLTRD
ncbi:MAG TPA: hypothetical protein PKC69_06055 [Chitinophagaceae bacterium]|nr:hypothetical protein [Chitinophagaceae bacterium]